MSTSIVDGTIEEAELKWTRKGVSLFKTIRFRKDDGTERVIAKAVTTQEVGAELTVGAKGRFYLFNAFDIRGVHGVRAPGKAVYGFPGNNEKIFLISGIVAALWVVVVLFTRGGIPILGAALLILAVTGYYFMHKGKAEAKAQFDGDSGPT